MPLEEVVVGRDEDDLKKYGSEGTILLGKHLVGKGEETHLTTPVLLDVLRPHVITLCGKRGSGKSYSVGVIAEEFTKLPEKVRKNLCILMIDTQGIYWTMESANEKESPLLGDWDLKPKGFEVSVYVPAGQEKVFADAGVDFDSTFKFADRCAMIAAITRTKSLRRPYELRVRKSRCRFELSQIRANWPC